MAKEQRIINSRVFDVHGLHRNVVIVDEEGKKKEMTLDAFSLVPALSGVLVSEDDQANWLVELVEDGTVKWSQVVRWVLAQIPIAAGKTAFPGVVGKTAKARVREVKFTASEIIEAFAYRQSAIDNLGPNPDNTSEQATKTYEASVHAEMVRLYTRSKEQQMDYTNWQPEEHVVMPKDIG